MIDKQEIKNKFILLRKFLKLNQENFAKQLEVSQPTISQIENGSILPSIEIINKIISKFNISYYWLLLGEGEMLRKDENPQQPVLGTSQPIEQSHNCEHLEKVINNLEKTIEIQQQQIDNLLRLVEILQRQQDFKPSKTKRD